MIENDMDNDGNERKPEVDGDADLPRAAAGGRSALLIVFLVIFIDLLGFGIILPLLPLYGDELLEPLFPGAGREPLRGVFLGLLLASFSAMQFIFSPIWGRISDRVGRRPILLLGLGGSVLFYCLFGIASEIGAAGRAEFDAAGPDAAALNWLAAGLGLMFVARLGAGVAGATISTAQAVIADSTPPERRARGMALIGAAFGIGFTFGPLVGFGSLFLPREGAPGFIASGLSLIAFILALVLLPETRRGDREAVGRRRLLDWQGVRLVRETPTVGLLILTFFLATLAFGGLESTLSLVNKILLTGETTVRVHLTREAARTTDRNNFLIFAYVGLVLGLAQGLYRGMVQRVGEVPFMRLGTLLMAVGLAGAIGVLFGRYYTENHTMLLVLGLLVMTVAVVGFACLNPSVQGLISRRSDPRKQGEILGVNQSASAMARILGPMVGLSLFDLLPSHALPYVFGSGVLVVVLLLTLRVQPEGR